MFKKFDAETDVSNITAVKSSVQKGIVRQLLESYPSLAECMDDIVSKKAGFKLAKCAEHLELYCNQEGYPLFYRQWDGPIYPTLRLLHKYPFILPRMQVDKGAIKFVLNGSNIMCPGLTSPGAKMTKVPTESPVAIFAEGKEHPLAIGLTKMSAEDIKSVNKGIGVENIHYLNDGLWAIDQLR